MSLKSETLKCFRPDPKRSGRFLLTEPHLLYLSDEQSISYLQAKKTNYGDGFHKDIIDIVEANPLRFLPKSEEMFSLVDLGPGYPDKTLPVLHKASELGLNINYIPVDVSSHYLDISTESVNKEVSNSVCVYPLQKSFEECRYAIPSKIYEGHVLVFLGPTYMNFPSQDIGVVLRDIAGDNGNVVVASEIISESNPIEKIMKQYDTKEAAKFVGGVIENLGHDPRGMTFFTEFEKSTGAINMGFEVEKPLCVPGYKLQAGDQIVTSVTHRYTLDQFAKNLGETFSDISIILSNNGRTALAFNKK